MPVPTRPPDRPRRLYVHVGLQKTGTSYLQGVLLRNAAWLAEQGLDLVPPTKRECFELMVVVRNRYKDRRDPVADRATLERFTAQLEQAPGDRALLSQESLAAASPAQVRRLLAACGDREVHVVATVRDLARQLPSSWQQELKAGGTTGYRRYLRRLQRQAERGSGAHPWIHLDPPAALARWSAELGPDRIHVVTVPPAGSDPTALLDRFCRVLAVDATGLEPEERPSNTSLGRVQAEVLRRVNADLPEEVHRRDVYGDVGKRFLAARVLAAQEPRRIVVPTELRSWCEEVAAQQVAALDAAGYPVEGSLDDLRCTDAAFGDDQRPAEREVAAASVSALSTVVTLRAAERRERAGGRRGGARRGAGRAVLRERLRPVTARLARLGGRAGRAGRGE